MVAPVVAAAAIAAAAGLAKSAFIDAPAADRQRKVQAAIAAGSPFTGIAPQPVQEAQPFGTALQFGLTAADMAQQAQQNDRQNEILESFLSSGGGGGASSELAKASPFQPQRLDPGVGARQSRIAPF